MLQETLKESWAREGPHKTPGEGEGDLAGHGIGENGHLLSSNSTLFAQHLGVALIRNAMSSLIRSKSTPWTLAQPVAFCHHGQSKPTVLSSLNLHISLLFTGHLWQAVQGPVLRMSMKSSLQGHKMILKFEISIYIPHST